MPSSTRIAWFSLSAFVTWDSILMENHQPIQAGLFHPDLFHINRGTVKLRKSLSQGPLGSGRYLHQQSPDRAPLVQGGEGNIQFQPGLQFRQTASHSSQVILQPGPGGLQFPALFNDGRGFLFLRQEVDIEQWSFGLNTGKLDKSGLSGMKPFHHGQGPV